MAGEEGLFIPGGQKEGRETPDGEGKLTDVVNTLAHDLRTPLACLKGYLSLLGEGKYAPGSPQWKEFFALCTEECDHIEDLIESLLESAIHDSDLVLHPEPVFLPSLIKRTITEVSALTPNRKYVVDIGRDSRTVWADRLRLEQVLRNLVENAAKYSPEGTLVVVKVRTAGDKGDAVQFSVSDQGQGIAPEHLNRLFERFTESRIRVRRPFPEPDWDFPSRA